MKKGILLFFLLVVSDCFSQTVYLSEDFASGTLPTGWTILNTQSPSVGWEFGDSLQSAGFNIIPNGYYAAINDDKYDNTAGTANMSQYCYLTTPAINCLNADSLRLEFDYYSEVDLNGDIYVKLAANGASFNYSYGLNENNVWAHFSWNIPASQYSSNLRIRFQYGDGGQKAKGFAIKNVRLFDPAALDMGIVRAFHGDIINTQNAMTGCRVKNNGLTTITSFDLTTYVDGVQSQVQNYSGIGIAYQTYKECLLTNPIPGLSPGTHTIRFVISNINGMLNDDDVSNDTIEFVVKAVPNLPERHPVVIDKTGAWCTYCADGSLRLDSALYNYPGSIGVAMHNGDMMDSLSSASWTGYQFFGSMIGGGYPKLSVDAYKFEEEVRVGFYPQDYSPYVAQRMCMYEPIGVELKNVSWDPNTQTVTATVEATVYDTIQEDIRPNLWVVADELYGLGTGWDQVNSANTWVGHPYYGLGNPIVGFHHHHVLLSMRGGPWGTQGLIPVPAYPGSVYQKTYSLAVPQVIWGASAQTNLIDYLNISLIGVVQKYNSDLTDRRILNATSGKLSDLINEVNEINSIDGISIYPTPAASEINFTSSGEAIVSISIVDLRGGLVFEKLINDNHASISTSGISNGLYIAKVRLANDKVVIRRCVVTH